jgi:hypothetical protein
MPAGAAAKARLALLTSIPAPTGGWISNRNLAVPPSGTPGAAVLDDFFPKSSTVMLRRGHQRYAALADGGDVIAMFTYHFGNNQHLFAASATHIYDITNVSGPTGSGTQMGGTYTSGRWSVAQYAAQGKTYLIGVNGVDPAWIYDGTTWSVMSGLTIPNGLTTSNFSYVWTYANRIWFAAANSLNAYYITNTGTIGGAVSWFPLGGVFAEGGTLLFGALWSMDTSLAGGLSEQIVFCSSEGEVAVYQGVDPANDFQKTGTYRIGTPLGAQAFQRGGGDIAIATSVGLVPLSKAITLDITALNVATISYNIADAWANAVQLRGGQYWQCQLWPEQKMMLVAPPDLIGSSFPVMFVANTETGAWARFRNWLALSMTVFQGQLYFGTHAGLVFLGNVSGQDDGALYTGAVAPLFVDLGAPASIKVGRTARVVLRAPGSVAGNTIMLKEYDTDMGVAPAAPATGSGSQWDAAIWDGSFWGATYAQVISQDVVSIGGTGYAVSLGFQLSSSSAVPLDAEVIRLEMTYETADFLS